MALKLVRRPWGRQPIGAAGINWGHPRAEGLAFFAPLSGAHGTRDLVQEQLGVRTGLEEYVPAQNGAIYHRFFSANRADFPLLPLGIGLNTPFTLAWTQEPRSGSAYSALLVVNFGTAGTDHQFAIYQSTSDASYSMVTGPLGAGLSASNTPRFSGIGVATNERLDRFVLQCSGGSQSVTTGDYVLWRNGERFTTSATAVLSAYRTAAFRIGALSDAGDPFEGLIGDMRMWSRVLSDGEAEEESTVHGSWALFEPQCIWVPVSAGGGTAQLVASAAASVTSSAQLSTDIKLSGSASASAAVAANLSTQVRLSASAQAAVTTSAALTTTPAGLSAVATASVSTSASLTTGVRLASAVIAQASTGAALTTAVRMQAAATAQVTTAAALTTGAASSMASAAVVTAQAAAALTTAIALRAIAQAQCTSVAALTDAGAAPDLGLHGRYVIAAKARRATIAAPARRLEIKA